jgi:hypothetical protein
MRTKFYGVIGILVLLILVVGYSLTAQRAGRNRNADKYFEAENSKNIEEDVRQAKRKGLSQIYIPSPKQTWVGAEDMDEVLRRDSVVYAKLVDKESAFFDNDKTSIVTWLRFEVIDHVVGPPIPGLPPPSNAPERLTRNFTPSFNFLVRVPGGSLHQDGVKVISDGPFPEFQSNNRFVLFVFFDSDAQEAEGGFNLGPQGVIPIDNKGALPRFSAAVSPGITKFIVDNHLADFDSLKASLRSRAQALN